MFGSISIHDCAKRHFVPAHPYAEVESCPAMGGIDSRTLQDGCGFDWLCSTRWGNPLGNSTGVDLVPSRKLQLRHAIDRK